ncbi:TPA: hypothetical protein ACH3X1_005765 [Trebouxia sp. C0004]
MKRMEVPRLPLHNLQGNSGTVPAEAAKQNRPTPVVPHEDPANENLTPPSRILRSGKRVPTGTATKVPPRTASKATRVAALSSDNLPMPQDAPAHVNVTDLAPGQAGKMSQHTPVAASAARQQSQMTSQGAASLQVASSTGPQTHTAQAAHTATPAATLSAPNQRLSSSPVLLDIQTSVSPMIPPISQPSPQGASPVSALTATDTSSPVALAPTVAQPEAPTPTLLPRGSSSRPILVNSPAEASLTVSLPQSSPRDILSSLQQMHLQSKPFNFAADAQAAVSGTLRESTPEASAEVITLGAQSDIAIEKTPEPFSFSSPDQPEVGVTPEQSSEPQETQVTQTEAAQGERSVLGGVEQAPEEEETALPVGYISRRTTDPYMQKKLRGLQKEEWSSADKTLKVHKSKLELAKEQAAAARSSELSDVDHAAVRRLVAGAFQRVIATGGQSLGESMVKHKSRLEREKEVAAQQRKAEEAAQAQKTKRKVVHTPGSWTKQGLGELGKHKSRLEKEKEAAAAARKAAGGSPALPKLPSYMRPTSASKAMQKGLGEDATKPKSRLEREKEAAAAAARTAGPGGEVRRSASGLGVRSKVAEAWQGQGLESVLNKHKSKLEQDKENAAAASAAASTTTSPTCSHKALPAARQSSGWGGQGLGDMKLHKSKLQKDKDAWAKAAKSEDSSNKAGSNAMRKDMLKESNSIRKSVTALPKKVPSYMKSTHTSTTRNSTGAAADSDARFAF